MTQAIGAVAFGNHAAQHSKSKDLKTYGSTSLRLSTHGPWYAATSAYLIDMISVNLIRGAGMQARLVWLSLGCVASGIQNQQHAVQGDLRTNITLQTQFLCADLVNEVNCCCKKFLRVEARLRRGS